MNNDPESDPSLFAGHDAPLVRALGLQVPRRPRRTARPAQSSSTRPSAGYPWQVVQSSWGKEKQRAPGGARRRARAGADVDRPRRRRRNSRSGRRGSRRPPQERRVAGLQAEDARGRHASACRSRTRCGRWRARTCWGSSPEATPARAGEAVLFTAHHDHLGIGAGKNGDAVYNGAIDNASGSGALVALAHAAATGPRREAVDASSSRSPRKSRGSSDRSGTRGTRRSRPRRSPRT